MAKKSKNLSLEKQSRKYGYIFTAPFIIGLTFGIIYPIVLSLVYSFGKIIPTSAGYNINFVALENYKYIFTVDATFNKMLVSTLKTTLLNVPVVVIFSFFLASVLNGNFFGRSLARTILFLPLILFSNIVMSLMSSDAVSASIAEKSGVVTGEFSGVFAELLNKAHISTSVSSILTSSVDNIGNILAMSVIPTIVILAGLQSISASVYEASYMEGATPWEVFWKISLPIVSPMILVSVIYCIIDSFTSVSNTVISRVRKECFTNLSLGLGSAMAWSYLLIVLLIVGACYLVANKFVSYSD